MWPLVAGTIGIALSLLFPPALWVCAVGVTLLAVVLAVNTLRTSERSYAPLRLKRNTKLTGAETAVALAAATLIAAPLIVMILRSTLN